MAFSKTVFDIPGDGVLTDANGLKSYTGNFVRDAITAYAEYYGLDRDMVDVWNVVMVNGRCVEFVVMDFPRLHPAELYNFDE